MLHEQICLLNAAALKFIYTIFYGPSEGTELAFERWFVCDRSRETEQKKKKKTRRVSELPLNDI